MTPIVRSLIACAVAGGALFTTGCSTRVADFTVVSTKNVELSRIDVKKAAVVHNVTGQSRKFIIVLFPTGVPTIQDAVDDALKRGGGDVMTSTKVEQGGWYIPFIFGVNYIKATGDVINSVGVGSSEIKKGE
jgi:hypothetical protein